MLMMRVNYSGVYWAALSLPNGRFQASTNRGLGSAMGSAAAHRRMLDTCSDAWTSLIQGSLKQLIKSGNTKLIELAAPAV